MSTALQSLDPKTAIGKLWQICDKPERFRALDIIDQIHGLEDDVFWDAFWQIWTSHESIFSDHAIIEEMIARHDISLSPSGLDDEERMMIGQLPDCVELYRGCRKHNTAGWSWSLDRERAEWFAKRSSGTGQPILLHAIAPRDRILAYLNGRGEEEIVIRPDDVIVHYRQKLPRLSAKIEANNRMYQMVHSGGMQFGQEQQAAMLVANSIAMGSDIEKIYENVQQDFEIASEFDACKKDFFGEVIRLIKDWKNGARDLTPLVNSINQSPVYNM